MNISPNESPRIQRREAGRVFYLVGIVLFVILAIASIIFTVQRADHRLRDALLISARLVSEGLDTSDLQRLVNGSAEEQQRAASRIQEQLSRKILASDRFAYIYLMSRDTAGGVYFLVDAQRPEEETPPSPLGEPYPEASEELKAIFDNKVAFVEGPVEDRWGVWISPFVPLLDAESGELLAVLGLDISAKDWKLYLLGIAALPALLFITLGLFIISLGRAHSNRQALRQHNQKLEVANEAIERYFNVSLDLFCITDAEGTLLRVNPAWESIFGYNVKSLVGGNFMELVHPEDQEATSSWMRQLSAQVIVDGFENRYRCSDGSYRWIEWRSKPVGGLYYSAARDVTDRHHHEEQLKTRDQFQQLLVRISQEYINRPLDDIDQVMKASLGDLGKFTGVDRAYIFDYDIDADICINTHEWCAEGITPQIDELQALPLASLPGWFNTHQRGEVIDIPDVLALPEEDLIRQVLEPQNIKSLTTVPLIDHGVCIGFVGFDAVRLHRKYSTNEQQLLKVFAEMIVNVGNRQKTEEALRGANYELEKQTQFATEMASKAQEANRAKSAFLAAMSHEIRTPLNSVIGMTSLLLNSELDEQESNYVSTIRTSGDALLDLINDILDFSKIESGRLELDEGEFEIEDCVYDPLEIMASAAGEKNLSLVTNLQKDLRNKWVGDVGRIRQIILNLISNAVRFSAEDATVAVNVEWEPKPEGVALLIIEVEDTGTGISEEAQKYLFQAFVQADSSITRTHGGTGLGLAISRQLARLMHGDLTFKSELGVGTTFRLELPLPVVDTSDTVFTSPGTLNLDGQELLLFVSCPADRLYFQNLAETTGLALHIADTIDEAIRLVDSHCELKFVILDEQLIQGENIEPLISGILKNPGMPKLITLSISDLSTSNRTAKPTLFEVASGELKLKRLVRPLRPSVLLSALGHSPQADKPKDEHNQTSAKHHIPSGLANRCPLEILIVEDNIVNQKIIVQILGKMGYTVDIVENGQLAVEAAAEKDYDLILMDMEMPVMDGISATRLIRRQKDRCKRPVISALSANVISEQRDECLKVGMDDFLSKPFRISELTKVIEKTSQGEYS